MGQNLVKIKKCFVSLFLLSVCAFVTMKKRLHA
jgi:hypothetical protein